MKKLKIQTCFASAFVLVSCFVSCNIDRKMIEVDGSSTVAPITEIITEDFEKVYKGIYVNIGISGTGGGFKKFVAKKTDISNASRPIKEKEAKKAKENGVKFLPLEVAYDGLAVVIHPENTWAETLTVQELKKLWSPEAEGKINKWSDLREGFPEKEIALYGPGTDSGTYDYFTEAIVDPEKGAPKSRSDFNANEDDNILVEGVSGSKYALGFFGLAFFEENKDKLKLVGVDNGNGAIKPSLETVKNGTYSPLSRPLLIYVSDASSQKQEVVDFVEFYLENSSKLCKEVGYIPLPDQMYEDQKEKFQQFISK